MNLQYITDYSGHKNGVLLSITDWDKIQQDLNRLKKIETISVKNTFFLDLYDALEESKLHSEGKLKLKSAKSLIDEL